MAVPNKSIIITVRIDEQTKKDIDEYCNQEQTNVSQVVNRLIKQEIKKWKSKKK